MTIAGTFMTGQQRQDFCDEFLRARNDGMTRIEAYRHARNAMSLLGKPYPAYNTLIHWLQYGLPKDSENVKKTADAESEEVGRNDTTADAESEEPEATEIAACGNEAEEGEREKGKEEREEENANRIDRATLYRALLRLYRYRREEDIDAVVDLTVPELSGEVEA